MRDSKRIDRILWRIKELWEKHPDMRFGQLLICLHIVPDNPKVWNNEDDSLERWLKEVKL